MGKCSMDTETLTESTGRVETATSETGSEQFTEEQSEANSDRSKESRLVFLTRKHVNSEHEHGGTKHLDKPSNAFR